MTKNIVFDLGNVILRYDPDYILKKYITDPDDIRLFTREVFGSIEWKDCDRGLGYRETVLLPCLDRLPPHLAELCRKICWPIDFELNNLPPVDGMEDLVKELKDNNYNIYLLSNVGLSFHDFYDKIPALKYFDGLFASCDYLLLKPEPEIFREFFKRYSLAPCECIFIDDTPVNVKASINSGMPAIRFSAMESTAGELRLMLRSQGIRI